MARLATLLAAAALCGCNSQGGADNAQTSKADATSAVLPFDNSTDLLHGSSLRVPREGNFVWDGENVDHVLLTKNLGELSHAPNAGTLVVAFEPNTTQTRVNWVRRQIIDSGLCSQKRCLEVSWSTKRDFID